VTDTAHAGTTLADSPHFVELTDFIKATSWEAKRRYLDDYPALLDAEVVALAERAAETLAAQGHEIVAAMFAGHGQLLQRCLDIGVDRAFAALQPMADLESSLPTEVLEMIGSARAGLGRYAETKDATVLADAVALWRRMLSHPALRDVPDTARALVLIEAAAAITFQYLRTAHAADLSEAVALLDDALAVLPPTHPLWPRAEYQYALVEYQTAKTAGTEALDQVIGRCEDAIGDGTDDPMLDANVRYLVAELDIPGRPISGHQCRPPHQLRKRKVDQPQDHPVITPTPRTDELPVQPQRTTFWHPHASREVFVEGLPLPRNDRLTYGDERHAPLPAACGRSGWGALFSHGFGDFQPESVGSAIRHS
jgi:hypothetical protein